VQHVPVLKVVVNIADEAGMTCLGSDIGTWHVNTVEKETPLSVKTIRFPVRVGFHARVKQRVHQYFADNRKLKTGDWRLFLKTGIIVLWFGLFYVLYVFFTTSLLMSLLSAVALAQGFILIGFNMMHDGAHRSYSRQKTINWLMGFTLDLIGGSHVRWRQKHNILHHTYTNIHAFDADLHTAGLVRLSPEQPWHPWHRWQHLYAWPAYSLLTLSWVMYGDFCTFFSGYIGPHSLPRQTRMEAGLFFATKLFYFGYMLVLPAFFHPVLHVLIAFVVMHGLIGFTLSLVFQLAHIVAHTTFPTPEAHTGRMAHEWAVHEVQTTANFAPTNAFAHWYLGGLNFQIEHHLFSSICHIHYPAISTIVRQTCDEFAIPYVCYPTVWAAIVDHYRLLKSLGSRSMSLPTLAGGTVL
jgi:linoleoyl-CoA desaturase